VPVFSLKIWIKEHVLWTVLAVSALLLIMLLAAYFIVRVFKRRRLELKRLQSKQHEIQEEANANRQALEDYQRQIDEKERLEKERHFVKIMQTKNLFPRLQYAFDGKNATFTVQKPETTIGRDKDNDLALLSDSISRHHAKLIFNGANFVIQDLGSTNKVIVNGSFIEQTILTNGDIIGLGEVVIHFIN
jgi:pSer/pThr/pTyr-binding forkhead associated (FHA) protein